MSTHNICFHGEMNNFQHTPIIWSSVILIQVATRVLWLGENIKEAIDALRIHHQLLPPTISYEIGIEKVG